MSLVEQIKSALTIDAATPMPAAIKQANEMMGLAGTGPMPQQAAALMAALGLSDAPPAAPLAAASAATPPDARSSKHFITGFFTGGEAPHELRIKLENTLEHWRGARVADSGCLA